MVAMQMDYPEQIKDRRCILCLAICLLLIETPQMENGFFMLPWNQSKIFGCKSENAVSTAQCKERQS